MTEHYRKLLGKWGKGVANYLRRAENGLTYYGTGESAHWSVQCSMNVCAAMAILGTEPEKGTEHSLELALSLFRYAMRTHLTGDMKCTDGKSWGNHWISVLGAERMAHGINALLPYMNDDDKNRYRNFREAESEWLLKEYPIVANMEGSSGKNRPESNIWNGGFLIRTAMDYPDLLNARQYLEKGTGFLLNGISNPLDAAGEERFLGKPLRQWFAGFNFTPNYSLDHHGYMNIGYSIICLSNIAMLHYNFKERGQEAPKCLYHHAEDLWKTVRKFIFPDGRLCRIGGDSRARYTYCQAYALPVYLFAADVWNDSGAREWERKYLNLIEMEQNENPSGMFYEKRLEKIRRESWYYYVRLESDPALVLSQGLAWRRRFPFPAEKTVENTETQWHDDFHSAYLIREKKTIRSYVGKAAQGPTALCLPDFCSSLAEWQGNLHAAYGFHKGEPEYRDLEKTMGNGFFHSVAETVWSECGPRGEGEGNYSCIKSKCAVAALPDGSSMIVLERAEAEKEVSLDFLRTVNLLIPNDIYNGHKRKYRGTTYAETLNSYPGSETVTDTGEKELRIDESMQISLIYGADSLKIIRFGSQVVESSTRPLTSLYADAVCAEYSTWKRWKKGEILTDTGVLLTTEYGKIQGKIQKKSGLLRAVQLRHSDGRQWIFAANFGEQEEAFSLNGKIRILSPGTSVLFPF